MKYILHGTQQPISHWVPQAYSKARPVLYSNNTSAIELNNQHHKPNTSVWARRQRLQRRRGVNDKGGGRVEGLVLPDGRARGHHQNKRQNRLSRK